VLGIKRIQEFGMKNRVFGMKKQGVRNEKEHDVLKYDEVHSL
jgi:hypothetical protein